MSDFTELYQVTLRGVCAGVVVEFGVVVEAAPVFQWAINRNAGLFRRWVERHGGAMRLIC
jgi:hypothetical protein